MKTILGLDLGTNSIGWALIRQAWEANQGIIMGMGSRIIPMSQDTLGDFGKGNSVSQTADRTKYRSVRRLRERFLLRRERLHRVLNIMDFLPVHFSEQIDFRKRFGKFQTDTEPKLAYSGDGFIFMDSFKEMLEDFRVHQPQILRNDKGEPRLVPYDWTIYYLRKKALSQKIAKEELAWIVLNFNQKRGYYQLREEDVEENPNKLVEFCTLKVVDVLADEPQKGKGDVWYSLILENGWVYRRSSKTPLFDWKDKTRDFIVTTDLNDDGSVKIDKEGKEKRSFRAPQENDWTLVKKKTEHGIEQSGQTVGAYIYDALLENPDQKIKGRLVRTIERAFYKEELKRILEKQREFHPEFKDPDIYSECVRELYKKNEAHRSLLDKKDLVYLLMEDIIFYQRPLRTQKSSISSCPLEIRKFRDENGVLKTQHLKVIPKSNPLYQEFRMWQWMYNLNIYRREDDANITLDVLRDTNDYEKLYDFLYSRAEIDQKALLKHFKLTEKTHRWNFVEDKKYPANETRTSIATRLKKVEDVPDNFLTRDVELYLWHIIYSVNDKQEYEKALVSFARKNGLNEQSFLEAFRKYPPYKSEYGAYSEKAIKRLLPLMRMGKHWSWADIDTKSQERIEKIITGEYDEEIKIRVREKAIGLSTETDFQGLQLWLAQYIVYGRHSEALTNGKWNSVEDLESFLKEFKQHSLRNPIVEQVLTEALRVVKDIWIKYGGGAKDFFDEIHIELGREMKLPKDARVRMTREISENENTNLRIKALLAEMINDANVENVRPYSPMQQEILKVYEEGVLNSDIEIEDDILKIAKSGQPTNSELRRYKLWLEQKYRSPYTGEIIPLNKLFTPAYEIEHVIPQSRYFDDSQSNKVICESAVNKLKDNHTGLSFIKQFGGTIVDCGMGKQVKVFKQDDYEDFVKNHYAKNRSKRNKLLMEDIPEMMVQRQINDTRYISKFISSILSNIVRVEDGSDEGVNSKNIIFVNGRITSQLKQDWGLNDVWNELILPRFERFNRITNSTHFTAWNENHQKFLPAIPLEYSKGFSKKRIDHRHHALDALVIACATRDHVNLMNNQSSKSENKRYDLQNKLRRKEPYFSEKEAQLKQAFKEFLKPWESFTADAKRALETTVVSFKQNIRVINKATNRYVRWMEKDGELRKEKVEQKGTNWAIRKSMHKDTVSGRVHLTRVKVPNGKFLTATRKSIDTSFNTKTIESITDTGIQKILRNYLKVKGSPDLAFTPEGLEEMNRDIRLYNDNKDHQPIYKARVFEVGSKFPVGQSGNKRRKFVEAAKGTNLFFAIYEKPSGERCFNTIPLNEVVERQKQGMPPVPEMDDNGNRLLFHISPNDLVYVPDEGEDPSQIRFDNLTKSQADRIYKMVSSTGSQCHFVQSNIASLIKNYDPVRKIGELDSINKLETCLDSKTQVKARCIKIKVNRLGNISKL